MKFLTIIFFLSLSSISNTSDRVTVKGVVFDRQGFIPSVTVTELGTEEKNRVYTNQQGEFEILTTTENPVLEFTFVGYAPKRIRVKDETYLKVKLKQDLLKAAD